MTESKNNLKYLTGYLNKVIRPLLLILPKTSGYVKVVKDNRDKNKNNKFNFLCIDDDKLLEKIVPFGLKLKKLDDLTVDDDRWKPK